MKNFKFTIKGHVYEVEIQSFENNLAEIEVNGTPYEVEIHQEVKESKTPVLVRKDFKPPKDAHKIKKQEEGMSQIKAPLPGTVLQVLVKTGDEVKKGDRLLVYEAMKMENNIMAEKSGKVKTLKVNPGDNVLEGDVLIEIE
ncbi:MAG: biotin/lipoyl-binding protein [Bacteroidales bacterium]|nr:biotin/lipoyl-binding protein [Bacteroidales bacterium]MCF8343507.1 biotin/lipoyl-binding protein [Bacteroidales bacterium]MCF8349760.1 biotin/lipoyl-binding protein [Bacteroidales bacterium]MCF8376279.1 biotin/lipoyl-binding protein [Bacteroidales bacterium]MCF8401574.1 biotin/lipoyl-binding protein [Bacteroidales bacterium]